MSKPLIEVVELWAEKKFQYGAIELRITFLYDGNKMLNSLIIGNHTIIDAHKEFADAKEMEISLWKILFETTAAQISDNEYVQKMAFNIFLSFLSKNLGKPLLSGGYVTTQGNFSIGNHGSYQTHGKPVAVISPPGSIEELTQRLPGMDVLVQCPARDTEVVKCNSIYAWGKKAKLWNVIQHLNDTHKWKRETQIADWLDKLHDDGIVDLSFKTPDN